jgi:triphosphoribosyl-dephospho-CoA synthase
MDKLKLGEKIRKAAVKALIYEVAITPKPGLVDRMNNGAHNDMDIFTFIDSAIELENYFFDCAIIAYENNEKDYEYIFKLLRERGIEADRKMYSATKGINTHKGAVFSLGLISAGAALSYINRKDFSYIDVCNYASQFCQSIFEQDFSKEKMKEITKGKVLYMDHGILGIRGEAKNGFPTITNYAYPYFMKMIKEGLDLNDAGVNVLLKIMINSQDTNIMARGGFEGLDYAKKMAAKALRLGGMSSVEGITEVRKMDKSFIKRNISPGGSADLLAATFMLYFLTTPL